MINLFAGAIFLHGKLCLNAVFNGWTICWRKCKWNWKMQFFDRVLYHNIFLTSEYELLDIFQLIANYRNLQYEACPSKQKLTSRVDTQGLTDSALSKLVRITAVTLGAKTDLKLFSGGVYWLNMSITTSQATRVFVQQFFRDNIKENSHYWYRGIQRRVPTQRENGNVENVSISWNQYEALPNFIRVWWGNACHPFHTNLLSEPMLMDNWTVRNKLMWNFKQFTHTRRFKKTHYLKMSSGKWRPFCSSLNRFQITLWYH